MAYATIFSLDDGGTPVVYERDDTNDGGPGTAGRHRLRENGVQYDPAPAGQPCFSPNYVAISPATDPQGLWPSTAPAVYRLTDISSIS